MLAREVTNPEQRGLDLIDIAVARNAYGRQVDSFLGEVDAPALGGAMPAVFIRAPRIRRTGPGVEILATHRGEPVLVRQGNVAAATFHPELTSDRRLHRLLFGAEAAFGRNDATPTPSGRAHEYGRSKGRNVEMSKRTVHQPFDGSTFRHFNFSLLMSA